MHTTLLPTITPARPIRILYAEDVHELRELARLTLSKQGHRIECVGDGQLALDRLSGHLDDFDLLISDHHMPRVNGLALVTQLRALGFRGKILIFCSELSLAVNEAYQRLGVDRILYKPVFPSDLRQLLGELFPREGSR